MKQCHIDEGFSGLYAIRGTIMRASGTPEEFDRPPTAWFALDLMRKESRKWDWVALMVEWGNCVARCSGRIDGTCISNAAACVQSVCRRVCLQGRAGADALGAWPRSVSRSVLQCAQV